MKAVEHSREFEQRLRELLVRQVDQTGGGVRSRLTRARHAALEHVGAQRGARRLWLPAAGVLAVAVTGVLLLVPHRAAQAPFAAADAPLQAQDVTLLTDRDGLAMLEGGDGGFYEWAAAQARGTAAPGSADGPKENGS